MFYSLVVFSRERGISSIDPDEDTETWITYDFEDVPTEEQLIRTCEDYVRTYIPSRIDAFVHVHWELEEYEDYETGPIEIAQSGSLVVAIHSTHHQN